jgi:hypothetical protein
MMIWANGDGQNGWQDTASANIIQIRTDAIRLPQMNQWAREGIRFVKDGPVQVGSFTHLVFFVKLESQTSGSFFRDTLTLHYHESLHLMHHINVISNAKTPSSSMEDIRGRKPITDMVSMVRRKRKYLDPRRDTHRQFGEWGLELIPNDRDS